MNQQEQERRARLLQNTKERLPNIKKQFEEAQKRNFNSNFKPGGKDAKLVKKKPVAKRAAKPAKQPKAQSKKVELAVSTRKGEMIHHQRMLSSDVNAQATQHIIGIPVNKSRYNG